MRVRRIIVVRHAESEEDINPNLNDEVSDYEISLTNKGVIQAKDMTQNVLSRLVSYNSIGLWTSPSNRAQQTVSIIKADIPQDVCRGIVIEERIRNLNWGSVTRKNIKEIEQERYDVGVLYYQFPDGDHSPTFVSNIYQFVKEVCFLKSGISSPEALIIVTHGFSLRIIAKSLLNMSDGEFKWLKNPPNCYIADFSISESGNIHIAEPLSKREPI